MFFLLFVGGLGMIFVAIVLQMLPQSVLAQLPDSQEDVTLHREYLWTIVLALLAYNVFAYEARSVAIGTGLFLAAFCAAFYAGLPAAKRTFFAGAVTCIGVVAGCALGFRANEFVQAVNVVTAILAAGALLFLHAVDRIEWNALWLLRSVIAYPAVVLRRLPGAVRLLKASKVSGLSTALRVIAITVVLVIFFAVILSSADPIFARKITILREQIVPRTLWSIVLGAVILVALVSSFSKRYTYHPLPLKFLSWVETAVPVGAVCVLFGVFLWVQITYLFGDHEAFKTLDLTYAEYVRKGMIEVLIATLCAGVLSYVVSLKERELAGTSERTVLSVINAVLLLELFLMLGSALKRDWMYMEVYGLTRVRVIGEIFLAWLACIILIFAVYALWRRLQEKAVFAAAIAASFAVVLYLNAFNMDATIASAPVPAGQKQDAFYVSLLSTDAANQWETLIGDIAREFEGIRQNTSLTPEEKARLANLVRAVDELAWERDIVLEINEPKDWTSWTWSRENAVRSMSGSVAFGRTLPCLETQFDNFRRLRGFDLRTELELLETEYNRPFVNGAASYNLTYVDGPSPGVDVASCL